MAIKNEYVLNFKSKGVNKTKNEVDKLDKSEKNLEKSSLKLKAGIAVAGVAILAMGKHAISTAAQFETLKVRLISMYGSVNAGTKAFQNFARVAATTPFARVPAGTSTDSSPLPSDVVGSAPPKPASLPDLVTRSLERCRSSIAQTPSCPTSSGDRSCPTSSV